MFADELHHLLHDMEGGHDESNSDVVVAFFLLADQLLPRWVLDHGCGYIEISSNVVQIKFGVKRAWAEHCMGPGHLTVKNLVANAGSIAVRFSQGSADTGKQDFLHKVSNEKRGIFLRPLASPENNMLSRRRRLIF